MLQTQLNRRQWMAGTTAASLLSATPSMATAVAPASPRPKSVAAIVTAYRKGLHADVLIGKILEGWRQDGGTGPALQLASMYVDQFEGQDLARPMAAKYNVPIFDSIEQAITLGGNKVAVDGVISIAEHGSYPYNDLGQHLYPRLRFFNAIADTFKKYDQVVPVFNDKHLGPTWVDAKRMYNRAQALQIPFMAGSSLPVTFRKPDFSLPLGSPIEAAVGIGYSGLDIYGSHSLDCYQCLVERRSNAEQGVRSVQCLEGAAMWRAIDSGVVDKQLVNAALAVIPTSGKGDMRDDPSAALFLFQYVDGFQGALLMLPRFAGGISTAIRLKNQTKPLATRFEERLEPRHPHFAYLLKGIERMVHTGKPSYPVERTLLTSGILDRALTSKHQQHQRLDTPELTFPYQPVDYPHAPHIDLHADPTSPLRATSASS